MRWPRKRGSVSNIIRVFIPDNSSTVGAGLASLTSASTNIAIAYMRELDSAAVVYSGANIETITTIGTFQNPSTSAKVRFKAVDATNFPGLYEVHFHDTATAFGIGDVSSSIVVNILELTTTALKIGPNMVLIPLVPWDYQDGVRMGLTALPSVAADAAGGLTVGIDGVPVALLDLAAGVETNISVREAFRLMLAVLVGKASGLAGTTATFRDTNDSKNRIVSTVDVNGNRSSVTLDAS